MEEEYTKRQDGKKIFLNLILFVVIIGITFYVIFKDQSLTEILEVISNANKKYIGIGILSMCMFFICDAINISRNLKALGEKSHFMRNLKYSLLGFFFSSITPSASGGQAMQIYYMKKDKISVANSTLILLLNLACVQFAIVLFTIIGLMIENSYLNSFLIKFLILGIVLNVTGLALLIIAILSRRMTNAIINFTIKVLKFLKVKKLDEKKEKIKNVLAKYQNSAKYIKENRKVVILNVITTCIQYIFFYSITYWTYKAFGLSGKNILQIASMQSIIYASASVLPLPGASGASEIGFVEIFKNIYPANMMNGAVLLSRGISFYLFVLLSAILVVLNLFIVKKKD